MTTFTFELEEFVRRRNALVDRVREDGQQNSGTGLVIIPAFRETHSALRYRPDSYFLYFTGFREPDAMLVLDITAERTESILFLRPKDVAIELWEGNRLGVAAAPEVLGVDVAYANDSLQETLATRLEKHQNIYHAAGRDRTLDALIQNIVDQQRNKVGKGKMAINAVLDFRRHADEMRLIKSPWEIDNMRHACQISAEVMTGAMTRVAANIGEHEIMGYLLGEYYARGLSAPSYPPIVGSYENSCVLHYVDNNAIMPKDAVTLIDAGGEYYGYCADITRVMPTNNTFTAAQKIIYNIVHEAHDAALEKVRVGEGFDAYHHAATRIICAGLIDLGWIHGDLETAIAEEQYKPYFMHRTGHFLGLDTHDVGDYRIGDIWRKLEVGMILTVEPGIYIRPADNIPTEFHNIGIRLEDDILVTADEPENMTAAAPINVDDVERLKY